MMAQLNESDRGVLLSSMSAASAALVLGRSARWVESRREELRADRVSTASVEGPSSRPAVQQGEPRPDREVKPLTRDLKRWTGWFLDAGWGVKPTADLFNLDPRDVQAAWGRR